ncbi:MAG: DUF4384 domain-containing protein [Treponema sp.]|nr:DUF4384 domain-containing protein [Treponema sp.]
MKELGKNSVGITRVIPAHIAQAIFVICFALTSQMFVFANGTQDDNQHSILSSGNDSLQGVLPLKEMRFLLRTDPAQRPDWVDAVPQSATEFFFIGTSQPFDTAANARDNSRENARNQVLKFYGEFMESRAIARTSIGGNTRDTLEAYVSREDELRSYAEHVISQVGTDRYFTEVYLNNNNKEEYIVYTLCQIGRQKTEDDIANFTKNISQRYAAMLEKRSTLKAAMEGYVQVVKALEQNPLHRITAYYDTGKGRVGLYGYIVSSINELANSLSIASLQNRTVKKSDTLDTVVKLQSAQFPVLGPFNCSVSITGMNMDIPVVNYTVTNDNTFSMSFHTNSMEPGRYSVQVEALLNELTGGIVKNISSGFSFEVTPLTLVLRNRNEIEEGIKKAVDTLAIPLKNQTETNIGPFTLTGTDIPTGLSRYLTERVTHHAINNPGKKYRVSRENTGRDSNKLVHITGFFTRRNNQVDVTLELITASGDTEGSQYFSIAVEYLAENGIAIDPENKNIVAQKSVIEPADTSQGINIKAFFNSASRTFLHRDELKMTLNADRNCYFKVIHIDVNNQMKMIYPNSSDKNNSLRANSPRDIFENAKYMLYGPYGAETIIIVASSEQFKNIEQEYIAPWTPATAETVRAAVRGGRSGELEAGTRPNTSIREGEAIYKITILKPHEEYEYGKPENMGDLINNIRSDALKQGGTFEGNEVSGLYTMNSVRGSYRVSRENPDKIQFAVYNMENFTGGSRAGAINKGAGFNFSFTRPGNMPQAISLVRAGIQEKGGTFNGNEQQGNFKASGITGQYAVAELVNVTITDKPLVIPNSLIEKEIKAFFGQR